MMKYKVGERVISQSNWEKVRKGFVGTVISSYMGCERNHFCVEFEKYIDGHDGNGVHGAKGKQGHCWWFHDGDGSVFEIVNKTKDFPKIVITTDGTETLARLYEGGKVVKSATAKCHPQDAFDAYIGAKIAFDRLLERPLAEEPKFFSGKAVCVKCESTRKFKEFTVGKIYEFVDGKTKDDSGRERPLRYRVDSTFETWKKIYGGMYDFLPIVD